MDVYISKLKKTEYPSAPFHPPCHYSELANLPYAIDCQTQNMVYDGVREVLRNLGFDKEHQNSADWNPLKGYVCSGQKVIIKPNLVRGEHPWGDAYMESMITHASVIRPIIDYVLLATGGNVTIMVGDVPLQDCRWDDAVAKSGLRALVDFYAKENINIELVDMRLEIAYVNKYDIINKRISNPSRDNTMYFAVDLGERSELIDVIDNAPRFEITDYGKGTVQKHHNKEKNEYLIPKEILDADLFINVPKLKTHRKAGYTCAMKNLIGINGNKSWIAHHTRGVKGKDGDEFNRISLRKCLQIRLWSRLKLSPVGISVASLLKKIFMLTVWKGKTYKQISAEGKQTDLFFEGSWHGNDTIWRCIKDLNKIVLYADKTGHMRGEKQRKYLCIVDAVWAGEKEGPMEQSPKALGCVFGGTNPVYVDYAASRLMKYSYLDLPTIKYGFKNRWWNLTEKKAEDVSIGCNRPLQDVASYFTPTVGWKEKLCETDINSFGK